MCLATEVAFDTLDHERENKPKEFEGSCVMTIKDQRSTVTTLALDQVDLKIKNVIIVYFL